MAKKGGTRHENRLNGTSSRSYSRKMATWGIRAAPGPHSRATSVPLTDILRDLAIGASAREIRSVLRQHLVKVNGRVRSDARFPVGLFDWLSVEGMPKPWRIIVEKHGRLVASERPVAKAPFKLSKISSKTMTAGRKLRFSTTDGENWTMGKSGLSVQDTVKWNLMDRKIIDEFALEKGQSVLVIGGQRRGSVATIEDVVSGTVTRSALVRLKPLEGEAFQTTVNNVFVIGPKGTSMDW